MPVLFIQLHAGQTTYNNERLGIALTVDNPVSAVNYLNIDTGLINAIQAGILDQITEASYYAINPTTTDSDSINTGYILTLEDYIAGCPLDEDALILQRGGVFKKLSWEDAKACINGGATPSSEKIDLVFRVGITPNPPGYTLPAVDAIHFISANFIDKKLRIEVNNIPIYQIENPYGLWYSFDDTTGDIHLKNGPSGDGTFADQDLVAIYEL